MSMTCGGGDARDSKKRNGVQNGIQNIAKSERQSGLIQADKHPVNLKAINSELGRTEKDNGRMKGE